MDAMKSRRNMGKRKAFTDLSNTISSSQPSSLSSSSSSSSSSLIKPQTKSSLSLPLNSLLSNNPNSNLNSNANFAATECPINDSVNSDTKKEKEKEKGPSNKANPSSTLSPPPISPSVLGIGDSVGSEPSTVYIRRHTADKRTSKGKEIVELLSCSVERRMPDLRRKSDGDGDIGLFKSCPMPCKKKQHQEKANVNASEHDLPQAFIDKQRAYFAEIDAFQLEEEMASANELE